MFIKKKYLTLPFLMAASLFAGTNSDCSKPCPPKPNCPQPCPPKQVCPGQDPCCPPWATPVLNAAYNYPAYTETQCPWDISFDISFLYWKASIENIELGGLVQPIPAGAPASFPVVEKVVDMDYKYKPGFQLAFGYKFAQDMWDSTLKYTRFHSTVSKSVFLDDYKSGSTQGGGFDAAWGDDNLGGDEGQAIVFQGASEQWGLKMDLVDLDLGRWYYVGKKLTFRPSFGLRAAWIRQNVFVEYTNGSDALAITGQNEAITSKNHSWAIGPLCSLESNWNVGLGFRLFGDIEADVLYTKITEISQQQVNTKVGTSLTPTAVYNPLGILNFTLKEQGLSTIRSHLDFQLGLGWGTYLDCHKWHLDFAAGYEFQVFFDQSNFWNFTDITNPITPIMPQGNLYIHGLTLKAALDF